MGRRGPPIYITHISVDPYAWLKPIYAQLRATPAFARLAPVSQFLERATARRLGSDVAPRRADRTDGLGAPIAPLDAIHAWPRRRSSYLLFAKSHFLHGCVVTLC